MVFDSIDSEEQEVITAKGQEGRISSHEWGRVCNTLKKRLIDWKVNLTEETKREFDRVLFLN